MAEALRIELSHAGVRVLRLTIWLRPVKTIWWLEERSNLRSRFFRPMLVRLSYPAINSEPPAALPLLG